MKASFKTRQIGSHTFLEFADGMVNASEVAGMSEVEVGGGRIHVDYAGISVSRLFKPLEPTTAAGSDSSVHPQEPSDDAKELSWKVLRDISLGHHYQTAQDYARQSLKETDHA